MRSLADVLGVILFFLVAISQVVAPSAAADPSTDFVAPRQAFPPFPPV